MKKFIVIVILMGLVFSSNAFAGIRDNSVKFGLSGTGTESVKNYLVEKLGCDVSELRTVCYGLERPVADNKAAGERIKNRRVEAADDFTASSPKNASLALLIILWFFPIE